MGIGEFFVNYFRVTCTILSLFFCNNCPAVVIRKVKTAVLIIGAPRSGTSATTGTLKILGLPLGNKLVGPLSDNIKGHFEDSATVDLNRALLKKLNSWPHDPRHLAINWQSEQAQKLKEEIKWHIYKRFNEFSLFGLKNPLISLLLPLYIQALKELRYRVKVIIVLRHPLEIAASLMKRHKITQEIALQLVEKFLTAVAQNSKECDKISITFEELINNTESVVTKIQAFLPELKSYAEVQKNLEQFLEKGLRHHISHDDSVLSETSKAAYSKSMVLYNMLISY